MLLIESRTGRVVGSVYDNFSLCNNYYEIKDEYKNVKYKIYGGPCTPNGNFCYSEKFFNIYDSDSEMKEENSIGMITKKYSDCIEELYLNANSYVTDFPKDATADDKLLIIGVTILIDYTLFEKEDKKA